MAFDASKFARTPAGPGAYLDRMLAAAQVIAARKRQERQLEAERQKQVARFAHDASMQDARLDLDRSMRSSQQAETHRHNVASEGISRAALEDKKAARKHQHLSDLQAQHRKAMQEADAAYDPSERARLEKVATGIRQQIESYIGASGSPGAQPVAPKQGASGLSTPNPPGVAPTADESVQVAPAAAPAAEVAQPATRQAAPNAGTGQEQEFSSHPEANRIIAQAMGTLEPWMNRDATRGAVDGAPGGPDNLGVVRRVPPISAAGAGGSDRQASSESSSEYRRTVETGPAARVGGKPRGSAVPPSEVHKANAPEYPGKTQTVRKMQEQEQTDMVMDAMQWAQVPPEMLEGLKEGAGQGMSTPQFRDMLHKRVTHLENMHAAQGRAETISRSRNRRFEAAEDDRDFRRRKAEHSHYMDVKKDWAREHNISDLNERVAAAKSALNRLRSDNVSAYEERMALAEQVRSVFGSRSSDKELSVIWSAGGFLASAREIWQHYTGEGNLDPSKINMMKRSLQAFLEESTPIRRGLGEAFQQRVSNDTFLGNTDYVRQAAGDISGFYDQDSGRNGARSTGASRKRGARRDRAPSDRVPRHIRELLDSGSE